MISFFPPVCSLAGSGITETDCEELASAIKSIISNLREVELSGDILSNSLFSVLSDGLRQPNLKKLRSLSVYLS